MDTQDLNEVNRTAGGQGVARACTSTPGAAAEPDAAPSNTASNKCNRGETCFVPLRWGVDSLYLSYPGLLADSVARKLEALKKLAQSDLEADQAGAQYKVDDHIFEVKDKGAGLFPFVLRDNAYRISLSRPKSGSVPMAYAQVSSAMLAAFPPEETENRLYAVLEQLGDVEPARVSRVDLFVDFTACVDMEGWTRQAWVTRAHNVQTFAVQGQFSGWAIGLGGVMACRLYNKTLEIETSGKEYLKELWREAGWDGETPVWRLEFQFKREVLTQLGLSSLRDVLRHLGGLWAYATDDWLRLTLPDPNDGSRSRWPVHPLWECLSSADWESNGGPLLRRFSSVTAPTEKNLLSRLFSSLTSLMALRGITRLDVMLEEIPLLLQQHIAAFCMFEGVHPDRHVEEQVRIKARRFNAFLNVEEDEAAAQAEQARLYRKAARGE